MLAVPVDGEQRAETAAGVGERQERLIRWNVEAQS